MGYLNASPHSCMNRVHKGVCVCVRLRACVRAFVRVQKQLNEIPSQALTVHSPIQGGGNAMKKDESWECIHTEDTLTASGFRSVVLSEQHQLQLQTPHTAHNNYFYLFYPVSNHQKAAVRDVFSPIRAQESAVASIST